MINLSELKYLFRTYHKGYERRASKKNLMAKFDLTDDRPLRKAFEKLRQDDFLIAANCGHRGYWLTTQDLINADPVEREQVKIMVMETNSRIARLEEMKLPFDNLLKNRKHVEQIEIEFSQGALTY